MGIPFNNDRSNRGVITYVCYQFPQVVLDGLGVVIFPATLMLGVPDHMQLHDPLGFDITQP